MVEFLDRADGVTDLGVIEEEPAMNQPPFSCLIRLWSQWIMMRHLILSIENMTHSTGIIGRADKSHKLRRLSFVGLLTLVIRNMVRIGLNGEREDESED